MSITTRSLNRRQFTVTAAGIAAGVFALPLRGTFAQDATPSASPVAAATPIAIPTAKGFVSMRVRTVDSAESLATVNAAVRDGFTETIAALDGYAGYLVGDVIDAPAASLSILVLGDETQVAGFDAAAQTFVGNLPAEVTVTGTESWAGDLLLVGTPEPEIATPVAALTTGYVAVRVHHSTEGNTGLEILPQITNDFLPIVSALPGFLGYLWFPVAGGFVAVTLYDSEASAIASNDAATAWTPNVAGYTDGNPDVINATVIFADLPIVNGAA